MILFKQDQTYSVIFSLASFILISLWSLFFIAFIPGIPSVPEGQIVAYDVTAGLTSNQFVRQILDACWQNSDNLFWWLLLIIIVTLTGFLCGFLVDNYVALANKGKNKNV